MLEIVINRDHPDQLAAIAQVEEALELLDAATGMVLNAAKSVSEFPSEKTFNDFIDASAPAAAAPDPDPSDEMKSLGAIAKELGIRSIGPEGVTYANVS